MLGSAVDHRYKHIKFLHFVAQDQVYTHLSETITSMIEEQPAPVADTEPPRSKQS